MNNNPTYFDAVHSLVGGRLGGPQKGPIAQFQFDDIVKKGVKEGYTLPTESEIQAEIVRLQAAYDAHDYARSRKVEYPDWDTQLDYMYHNGFEKWKTDMIDPIKDKYPKPE
jgi:hypothetical protein